MLGTIYCSCTLHLSQLPSSQGKMKKQYELLSGKRDPWNMQSFHKSKLFSLNGSFCCGACVCAQPLQLCPTLCDAMDCRLLCPWDSPGKNTGVGCHAVLQRSFSTQGSNSSPLHWQAGTLLLAPPGKPYCCSSLHSNSQITKSPH